MWSPYCRSSGEWYANKILQGFFGSPIESLCEISVADLVNFTFLPCPFLTDTEAVLHSSTRQIYGTVLFIPLGEQYCSTGRILCHLTHLITLSLVQIFSGFIYDGMGWKWVLYWPAIWCGIGFVILFFLMEETNYDRGTIGVIESAEASIGQTGDPGSDVEKVSPANDRVGAAQTVTADVGVGGTYKKKTYWNKLSLFSQPSRISLLTMTWRPFTFVSLPVIVYSGFAYGCTVVWALLNSATASLVLSSAPYYFKSSIVGLFSLASLIGCVVG